MLMFVSADPAVVVGASVPVAASVPPQAVVNTAAASMPIAILFTESPPG